MRAAKIGREREKTPRRALRSPSPPFEVSNLPGRCCRHSLPQPPGYDKGCRQNKF
ncbi:MAG: hypothetical protein Q7W38_10380 [Deltaproteobacteria bacterium]|nr:hypothetical protein [Deltaproteobacteria bacterium]